MFSAVEVFVDYGGCMYFMFVLYGVGVFVEISGVVYLFLESGCITIMMS